MSKVIKVKVTEVALVTRNRIVDVEVVGDKDPLLKVKGLVFDLDDGKESSIHYLEHLTFLVKEQHSHEGDLTEQIIKAEIL